MRTSKSAVLSVLMFVATLTSTVCAQTQSTSYTTGAGWTQVTSSNKDTYLGANSVNYLFAIWVKSGSEGSVNDCFLRLAYGQDGQQGASNLTMRYAYATSSLNPNVSLDGVWELIPYPGGADGQYVIASAYERNRFMQVGSDGVSYRLASDEESMSVSNAKMTLSWSAGSWVIANGKTGGSLGSWGSSTSCDVTASSDVADCYAVYAISRIDYLKATENIVYTASSLNPKDVTMLMVNPEAFGTSGDQSSLLGWTLTSDGNIWTKQGDTSDFSVVSGNSFFEYSGDTAPADGYMRQTLTGLPAGYYTFSVTTSGAQDGAMLYATGVTTSATALSTADASHKVYVTTEVTEDGGSITFGVSLSSYQPDDEVEDGSDSYVLRFDNFEISYLGTYKSLVSSAGNGEYYVRTNIGTDDAPEYRYLDAGGNMWGTEPVLGEHGFSLLFTERTDSKLNDGNTYYSLKSYVYQSTGSNHDRYFDGYQYDHTINTSWFRFEQVDPENNPTKYRMFTRYPLSSSGSKGYIQRSDDGSTIEVADEADDSKAVWEIITETQRVKELHEASVDNPLDATFLIKDPDFSRNNVNKESWCLNSDDNTLPITLGNNDSGTNTVTTDDGNMKISIGYCGSGAYGGNSYDYNVKMTGLSTDTDYKLYQKVAMENLPAGRYRLSVHGYSNVSGGATLFAANENGDLGSVALVHSVRGKSHASDQPMAAYLFTGNEYMGLKYYSSYQSAVEEDGTTLAEYLGYETDGYVQTLDIEVTTETLIIGVRGTLAKNNYAIFDKFELYYLGEVTQSIENVTSSEDYYIYNVDAGLYLNQSKSSSKYYSTLNTTGICWTLTAEKDDNGDLTGRYSIYNNAQSGYVAPSTSSSNSFVYVNSSTPYYWNIQSAGSSNADIVNITDSYGRVLEWCGDAANLVISGSVSDTEPRGTRWALYTATQYEKDRMYVSTASTMRSNAWPVVRSARLSLNTYGGAQLPDVEEAYAALDEVWTGTLSKSSNIASLTEKLRLALENAMTEKASMTNPFDMSYNIADANCGDSNFDGWTTHTNWSSYTYGLYANSSVVLVGRYFFQSKAALGSQTISGLKPGMYRFGVDMRSRNTASQYVLTIKNVTTGESGILANETPETITLQTLKTASVCVSSEADEIELSLEIVSGSVAFDNFKLYYCGTGRYQFNSDCSELTLQGEWKTEDFTTLAEAIESEKNTLGAVFITSDNVTLNGTLEVSEPADSKGAFNILFYTDLDGVTGDANVVRMTEDGNTCENLVLTDGHLFSAPLAFTAATASYTRGVTVSSSVAWGTIMLPFALSEKPSMIDTFFDVKTINTSTGKLSLSEVARNGVVAANTPLVFTATGDLDITEYDVDIDAESDLKTPDVENDGLCLYGTYKKYIVGQIQDQSNYSSYVQNADGLCAHDCYYVKGGEFWRGNGWFSVNPFRSFVFTGEVTSETVSSTAERPTVLDVDFSDIIANDVTTLEDNADTVETGRYNAAGIPVDNNAKGFSIVRMSDGTVRKVMR